MVKKQVARRTAKDKITYDKPKTTKKMKMSQKYENYTQVDNDDVDNNIDKGIISKKDKNKKVSTKVKRNIVEKPQMNSS